MHAHIDALVFPFLQRDRELLNKMKNESAFHVTLAEDTVLSHDLLKWWNKH
jgi:hypothetical protein